MKETAVFLGRFSPFHKGHEKVVRKMIKECSFENSLVLIGSSDSYNFRTPFTFEQRKRMIRTIFPNIRIRPLPDINSKLAYFDGSTNNEWLASLSKMEKKLGTKFVFYGGSVEDLKILEERFKTKIAIDRLQEQEFSATEVRKALDENDEIKLSKLLSSEILPQVKHFYRNFLNTIHE